MEIATYKDTFAPRVYYYPGSVSVNCAINYYYIDNIIIYSKTIDEHLEHIKEVFKRLKEVELHLKLRKCEFFMEQMEFLGHTIDREGIRPNKDKIKAILDMPVPKTKTNVKFPRTMELLPEIYQEFRGTNNGENQNDLD
jgi:hypothetical protein